MLITPMSKQKQFYDHQVSSILKGLSLQEGPAKEKHVRAIIIGSYVGVGCELFWKVVMENMPLQGNQIVCWKFLYVLYKLLRDGQRNTLEISYKFKSRIKDLGKLWSHLKDDFSILINYFCVLISNKLEFHNKNPHFPNNLILTQTELDKIYGDDDVYFQVSTVLLDYLEDILRLQSAIFQSLEINNLNSLTSAGQLRIQPLVPCIQEAVLLYDHIVYIMRKLHTRLDHEFLVGHRKRFEQCFNILKKFFQNCIRLQYLKNLVAIPQLTEMPNFLLRKSSLPTYSETTPSSNVSTKLSNAINCKDNFIGLNKTLYEQSQLISKYNPGIKCDFNDVGGAHIYERLPQETLMEYSLQNDTLSVSDQQSVSDENMTASKSPKDNPHITLLSSILLPTQDQHPNKSESQMFNAKNILDDDDEELMKQPYFHNGIAKTDFIIPSVVTTKSITSNTCELFHSDNETISNNDTLSDNDENDIKLRKISLDVGVNTTESLIQLLNNPSLAQKQDIRYKDLYDNYKYRYDTLKGMYDNLRNTHFKLLKQNSTRQDQSTQSNLPLNFSSFNETPYIITCLNTFLQSILNQLTQSSQMFYDSTGDDIAYSYKNNISHDQLYIMFLKLNQLPNMDTILCETIIENLSKFMEDSTPSFRNDANLNSESMKTTNNYNEEKISSFLDNLLTYCYRLLTINFKVQLMCIISNDYITQFGDNNMNNNDDFEMVNLELTDNNDKSQHISTFFDSSGIVVANKQVYENISKVAKNVVKTMEIGIKNLISMGTSQNYFNVTEMICEPWKMFNATLQESIDQFNHVRQEIMMNSYNNLNNPQNQIDGLLTQTQVEGPNEITAENEAKLDMEIEELYAKISQSSQHLEQKLSLLIKVPSYNMDDKKLLELATTLMQNVKLFIEQAAKFQNTLYLLEKNKMPDYSNSTNNGEVQMNDNSKQPTTIKFYYRGDKWNQGYFSAAKIVGISATFFIENVHKLTDKKDTSIKFEEIITLAKEVTKNLAHLIWSAKVKNSQIAKRSDSLETTTMIIPLTHIKETLDENYHHMYSTSKIINEKIQSILSSLQSLYITLYQRNMEINLTNLTMHQAKMLEMETQIKVLELESQLEKERSKLLFLRKNNYHLLDNY